MSASGIVKTPLTLTGVYVLSGVLFLIGTLLTFPLFNLKDENTEVQPVLENK
jgi:predicted transporter